MKLTYTAPEATVITIRLERRLLNGSPTGAQTQGFTTAGEYDDDDWAIE